MTGHSIRRPLFALAISLFLLAVAIGPESLACPFCLSPPQTLTEQISRADLVVIAELVRFRVYDNETRPESTLRIREYLLGEEIAAERKELTIGQPIVIPAEAAGEPGDLFLMYGELTESPEKTPEMTFADSTSATDSASATATTTNDQAESSVSLASFARQDKAPFQFSSFWTASSSKITWNETTAISRVMVDYLQTLPPKEEPQANRLQFFLRFLEHNDPMIAIDAWAEFGNSKYEDVVAVKKFMSPQKLRTWIADPMMSPERLGLYGMMLGLCGSASDAQFLAEHMREPTAEAQVDQMLKGHRQFMDRVLPSRQFSLPGGRGIGELSCGVRYGSEGLMGGYLLLTGEAGLRDLEESVVLSKSVPGTTSHAFVQSLQFIWSYESDLISRARICQSMQLLLDNETMREIAITNLSRWEHWSALPELKSMFYESCANDRDTQRAILQFAQACVKSGKKTAAIDAAADAAEFICNVQGSHPDLLSTPVHDFGPPQ